MNDMSQVIIPKSDQWNADDFIAGPATFTIQEVRISPGSEQPVSIVLEGTHKFYRPCKSMSRVLVQAWGPDASKYVGRSLTLYRDPTVKWAGMEIGGIRISHLSDIGGAKEMMLTATKGSRKPFKVMPLVIQKGQDDDEQELALKAITEAAGNGTEALSNAWKQKWMAPHREALQMDLERLKTVAAEHDPDGSEIADERTAMATVAAYLERAKAAETTKQLVKIIAEAEPHKEALGNELAMKLELGFDQERNRIEASEGVSA